MPKNNVELWKDRREWLDYNEYTREMTQIVDELFVVGQVISTLPIPGDSMRDGLSGLLNSIAVKVTDLSHGRLSDETLPG